MELDFFKKPLEKIKFADVKDLVDNKVPEANDLDYKEDYPKNLAKIMIGFSNASGGYIILGVRCEPNTNIPKEIVGVDREEHATRITQIALGNSQPRMWPKVKAIPNDLNTKKDIVIIKINEAFEPIMYTKNKKNNFPIRINDKTEPADQGLVKKIFSRKNVHDRIEILQNQIHTSQLEKFNEISSRDQQNRYVLLGFSTIPFNKDKIVLDLNQRETEDFIKNLRRQIGFRLYPPLVDFDNYLYNFAYLGAHYRAEFHLSNERNNILTTTRIYDTGVVSFYIIYRARTGEEKLQQPEYHSDNNIDEIVKKHSAFLDYRNIPALSVIYLFLCKLLYQDRFIGKVNLSIRCLTKPYQIFMVTEGGNLDYSNTNDFTMVSSFNSRDLNMKSNFKVLIKQILEQFLRYFGTSLKIIDRRLSRFIETSDRYLAPIFPK